MRTLSWILLVGIALSSYSQKIATADVVPVIITVEGDALVDYQRHHTSPLLIDHRPFHLDEALADQDTRVHRALLAATRASVRRNLQSLGYVHAGETDVVMHTLLGRMPANRIAEARAIPGVVSIIRARIFHKALDGAIPLMNGAAAWQIVGGETNAGHNMKVGMIDTGIDINNPMLQDFVLTPPAGFPKGETLYTNNKIIVARNYVAMLGYPSDPQNAQDRDGHGTFTTAMAVGRRAIAPFASLAGAAPGAFAGNYKVFSSPEFSGGASGVTTNDAALVAAINDAVADGMNVINMSLGGLPVDLPAFSPLGIAVTAANNAGVLVVCAAGNDGPDAGTISEPGNSPEAISVGASRNSRILANLLAINGPGTPPSSLKQVLAVPSDAPPPAANLRATLWPLIGSACNAYSTREKALNNIVMAQDDFCDYTTMSANASAAGAKALVVYRFDDYDPMQITGLTYTTLPVFEISATDGAALASYSKSNQNALDTSIAAATTANPVQPDSIASFSSEGPDGVTMQLKPDLVAPGTTIYSAAETTSVLGALFSPTQFSIADGTSFSTPLVSGTALLVRQLHPDWTPAQVKSALVNRAANVATEGGIPADLVASGAGRLDMLAAMQSTAALAPTTLSFSAEYLTAPATFTRTFTITNLGTSAESFSVALQPRLNTSIAAFTVAPSTTPLLNPRETATVTLTLAAKPSTTSSTSVSDGRIVVTGATSNRAYAIPYWSQIVDSTVASGFYTVRGNYQTQSVGSVLPQALTIEVVDDSGLIGIAGVPVTFSVIDGGGTLSAAKTTTDFSGFASTVWTLGSTPGQQRVLVTSAGQTDTFYASAMGAATFTLAGLVNAASSVAGAAPGSIVSLYGTGLSASLAAAGSIPLPVALGGTQVLFGNTASPLFYVSPNQVNFQVPFELAAGSSVQMRDLVGGVASPAITVPLVAAAPGLFSTVLHADNAPVTAANPAVAGETITIFGSGFGAVDQTVASGAPSPVSPVANTKTLAVVRINGNVATVPFSGLAPGVVGLYQANVVVPPGTASGSASLTLAIGSAGSNAITVAIK